MAGASSPRAPTGRLECGTRRRAGRRGRHFGTGGRVTPPLRQRGQVGYAGLSPDGHRVLTANWVRPFQVWDLSRDSRPLSDLVLLAQWLAGQQPDGATGYVPIDPSAARRVWQKLKLQ